MRNLLIAALLAVFATPAWAIGYCGPDADSNPGNGSTVYFPYTGRTVGTVGKTTWSYGLDNGDGSAVVVENVHRNCGIIALYLYTGHSPQNQMWVYVHLDPAIVNYNVAQGKCTAGFSTTSPIYYNSQGYETAYWPNYMTVQADPDGSWVESDNYYGGAQHLIMPFFISGNALAQGTAYTLVVDCPPNHPSGNN